MQLTLTLGNQNINKSISVLHVVFHIWLTEVTSFCSQVVSLKMDFHICRLVSQKHIDNGTQTKP